MKKILLPIITLILKTSVLGSEMVDGQVFTDVAANAQTQITTTNPRKIRENLASIAMLLPYSPDHIKNEVIAELLEVMGYPDLDPYYRNLFSKILYKFDPVTYNKQIVACLFHVAVDKSADEGMRISALEFIIKHAPEHRNKVIEELLGGMRGNDLDPYYRNCFSEMLYALDPVTYKEEIVACLFHVARDKSADVRSKKSALEFIIKNAPEHRDEVIAELLKGVRDQDLKPLHRTVLSKILYNLEPETFKKDIVACLFHVARDESIDKWTRILSAKALFEFYPEHQTDAKIFLYDFASDKSFCPNIRLLTSKFLIEHAPDYKDAVLGVLLGIAGDRSLLNSWDVNSRIDAIEIFAKFAQEYTQTALEVLQGIMDNKDIDTSDKITAKELFEKINSQDIAYLIKDIKHDFQEDDLKQKEIKNLEDTDHSDDEWEIFEKLDINENEAFLP